MLGARPSYATIFTLGLSTIGECPVHVLVEGGDYVVSSREIAVPFAVRFAHPAIDRADPPPSVRFPPRKRPVEGRSVSP
ncbi:hypothetical protein PMAYCL1PPCAC_13517, partial [Pristionchus mayeri]